MPPSSTARDTALLVEASFVTSSSSTCTSCPPLFAHSRSSLAFPAFLPSVPRIVASDALKITAREPSRRISSRRCIDPPWAERNISRSLTFVHHWSRGEVDQEGKDGSRKLKRLANAFARSAMCSMRRRNDELSARRGRAQHVFE